MILLGIVWPHGSLYVEGHDGILCSHVQGTWCALNQRDTTVAADGESAADGNLVFAQVRNQHLFHTAVLEVVLDGVERAEDDALHSLEILLQRKHVEQPVDAVQRLLHLFDKEDDVLFERQLVFRSCYGGITGEVASYENALRMTDTVVGVAGNPVLRHRTEEDISSSAHNRSDARSSAVPA